MQSNTTSLFNVDELNEALIAETKRCLQAVEERGYNPINQIVGYIMSDDQVTSLIIERLELK